MRQEFLRVNYAPLRPHIFDLLRIIWRLFLPPTRVIIRAGIKSRKKSAIHSKFESQKSNTIKRLSFTIKNIKAGLDQVQLQLISLIIASFVSLFQQKWNLKHNCDLASICNCQFASDDGLPSATEPPFNKDQVANDVFHSQSIYTFFKLYYTPLAKREEIRDSISNTEKIK